MGELQADRLKWVYRPVSLPRLLREGTFNQKTGIFVVWFAAIAASIGLGLATVIFEWSGLPLRFGGADIYLTIYPPLAICTLLVLIFGFWWGAIPAYFATFILALYSGMPVHWAALFGLSNPLGFAVFSVVYRAAPISLNLRTLGSILFFMVLAFFSAVLGATGAFIWTHTHPVGAYQVFAIWQGWWVGNFLQTVFLVGPLLAVFGPVIARWRDRQPWTLQKVNVNRKRILTLGGTIIVGVFLFLFLTFNLIEDIFLVASETRNLDKVQEAFEVVLQSTHAVFWVMAIAVIAAAFLGHQFFTHWTASLSKAKEKAETANKAKSKFLAATSHDLRQPLQAINLFVYALKQKDVDEQTAEIINNIENSAESLKDLLNVLLDMSYLEAGLVIPKKQKVSFISLVSSLVEEFEPVALEKGLELRTVPCRDEVYSDPVLLKNILRNLLSNAVRHSNNGKILLGCRRHGNNLRIEVWDNGLGIGEDHLETIFEEFYQVGNPARDRRLGLGLGLSIVRRTTELLGHKLSVDSNLGMGSVFSIEVPRLINGTPPGEGVTPALSVSLPENAFIVVIEDDVDVLKGVQILLEQSNCKVLALPCIGYHDNNQCDSCRKCDDLFIPEAMPPDLLIVDYNLQKTTGIEASNMLNEQFGTKVPAIMLTGDISPDSLVTIEKCGFPVLHKPIQGEKLQAEIAQILTSGTIN